MSTAIAAPLAPPEVWRRFRAPAMAAAALLLAGYLRAAPGAEIHDPSQYRRWAFGALAYSDVLALHADRGGGRHPVPYFEDRVEYPALLGVAMWLPSIVAPRPSAYFGWTYALGALAAMGALWALCAIPGTQPWAFAASPALVVAAPLNWDLLGILPLAVGLWLWSAGRERGASAALALGGCVKVLPAVALVLLCASALRRGARHAALVLGVGVAVALAVNLPFALPEAARTGWAWFFEYSRYRAIEPSLYLLLGADPRASVPTANLVFAVATALALLAAGVLAWRSPRIPIPVALLLVFGVVFLSSKVFSPQYWLWVTIAAALAAVPGWVATGLGAVALADYVASFSRLHLQTSATGPSLAWFEQQVFWPIVTLRYVVLFTLTAWAAGELAGALRPEVERAPRAAMPPPSGELG